MSAEPRDPDLSGAAPPHQPGLTAGADHSTPFDAAGDLRFRAIVQNATDLVSISDRYGVVRYISPSVTRILGYSPDELVGRSSFDFLHPDDLQRVVQRFAARVERTSAHTTTVMRFRHRDGSWRTLEALSTNLLDHPEIQGVVVNARDITERIEQERRLALQASILAQINDAVVGVGPGDAVIYWNATAARMFGLSAEEAQGRPLAAIYRSRTLPPSSDAELRAAISSGRGWSGEAELSCADGRQLIAELSLSHLRDERGEPAGVFVVIRDISERRRVVNRLRLMEAVVVNANDAVLVTEADPLGEPGPRICYVNEAFTRLTGYAPEQAIGRSPRFLQGPRRAEPSWTGSSGRWPAASPSASIW